MGALAALTAALTAGYLAWSDTDSAFWTPPLDLGLLGAAVIGALLARLVSRLPAAHAPTGMSGFAAAWAGVVYGTAEGLLLSVLPVVVTWQLFAALGWTDGWQAVVAAVAALAASRSRDCGPPPGLPGVPGLRDALPAGGLQSLDSHLDFGSRQRLRQRRTAPKAGTPRVRT